MMLFKVLLIIILCGIAGWAIYCGVKRTDWKEINTVVMPTEEGWVEVIEKSQR